MSSARNLKGLYDCVNDTQSAIEVSAKYAYNDCVIDIVYGKSGTGKTKSVEKYASTNNTVAVVYAEKQFTPKKTLKMLCESIGVDYYASDGLHKTSEQIIERLKENKRLILVDNASKLTYESLEA